MTIPGLIFSAELDGLGGAHFDNATTIPQQKGKIRWLHLNYTANGVRDLLEKNLDLDPHLIEALTAEVSRPRFFVQEKGLLIILRGVNLNPGADPEDMISLRAWITDNLIITMRRLKMMTMDQIYSTLEQGTGPKDSGAFLVKMTDGLISRTAKVVAELDDHVDDIEEKMLVEENRQLRSELGAMRRQILRFKRYIMPQREVLSQLHGIEKLSWLEHDDRLLMREIADRSIRLLEDLELAREKATVTREELENRLAEHTNQIIYLLSLITTIFLPLGLITGLLGINVGGIPGAESPYGFLVVCSLLVIIVFAQVFFIRKARWY
jgi:zinc transporter